MFHTKLDQPDAYLSKDKNSTKRKNIHSPVEEMNELLSKVYVPAIVDFLQPNLSTREDATGPSNNGRAKKILPSHAVVPVNKRDNVKSQAAVTMQMRSQNRFLEY